MKGGIVRGGFVFSLLAAAVACSSGRESPSAPVSPVDDAGRPIEPLAGDPPARVSLGRPGSDGGAQGDGGSTDDGGESASTYDGLVVNEIDYDQVGTDDAEFVELYNGASHAIDLSRLALVMTTASAEYGRIALSGSVPAGGYVVIASPSVTLVSDAGVLRIPFKAASSNLRNTGPAAVGILDLDQNALVDALSYAGAVSAADVSGASQPLDFVEGTAATAVDSNTVDESLIRSPNGSDTDDADTDWKVTKTKTPGGANVLTP